MSITRSGNATHDATCLTAELVRQNAMVSGVSAATAKAADIAFHRSVLASAIANGIGIEVSVTALKTLGTGGS